MLSPLTYIFFHLLHHSIIIEFRLFSCRPFKWISISIRIARWRALQMCFWRLLHHKWARTVIHLGLPGYICKFVGSVYCYRYIIIVVTSIALLLAIFFTFKLTLATTWLIHIEFGLHNLVILINLKIGVMLADCVFKEVIQYLFASLKFLWIRFLEFSLQRQAKIIFST